MARKRDLKWMWTVWWTGQSRRRQRLVCEVLNLVFYQLKYSMECEDFLNLVKHVTHKMNEQGIYLQFHYNPGEFRVRRYRDIFNDFG